MPSKNLVILVGHLGGDPDIHYNPNGMAICNFSLATNWGKKGADGDWQNFTDWHKVVCFGSYAEKAAENLKKGDCAMIEGTIRYESWETEEGEKKYATKIIANRLDVMTTTPKTEEPEPETEQKNELAPSPEKEVPAEEVEEEARKKAFNEDSTEDDLPF